MKGKNRGIGILAGVLLLVIGFVVFEIFGIPALKKYQDYQKADQLLQDGKYEEAKIIYWSLGEYSNAQEKRKACDYGMAEQAMKKKDFESAKMLYEELGEYGDSKDKIKHCDYKIAESYKKEESYEEAAKIYKALGTYKQSKQRLLDCKNGMAAHYFEACKYQEAYELYDELAKVNYKGAKKNRQKALQEVAHDAYDEVIEDVERLDSYAIYYAYYDISGDGVDEMFFYDAKGMTLDNMVGIIKFENGELEAMGTMELYYPYMHYSKEAKILYADMASCGCINSEIFQYKDGKVTSAALIHASDYEYLKDELPKGKFKKDDFVYCYTETDKESQYFTKQEFEAMFQKKYKVGYDGFWEEYEQIEWNYLCSEE